MKNAIVTLTNPELMLAGQVGVIRRVASYQNGNDCNWHAKDSSWATDIDGVMAEMAVAKYLDVYYVPTVNTFKQPDVAGFIQVKSTNHHDGHLILRDNDARHHLYVLVITRPDSASCRLVGCIWGSDAERIGTKKKLDADADCWWVSQGKLPDLPDRSELSRLKEMSDARTNDRDSAAQPPGLRLVQR